VGADDVIEPDGAGDGSEAHAPTSSIVTRTALHFRHCMLLLQPETAGRSCWTARRVGSILLFR
jgi:hypothetical protein